MASRNDACYMQCTEMTPQWIRDLNVRSKTVKLLEETKEEIFQYFKQWFLSDQAAAVTMVDP